MNSGKVPVNVLKRSVLRQLKNKRTEIANSAGLGADCAVFAPFSEGQMVTCVQEGVVELQCENDLAEAEREDLSVMPMRRIFQKCANNLAAAGAEPVAAELVIFLPETVEEPELKALMEEAEKSGIALACHFQAINEGMLCVKPDHVSLTAQGQVFSWMNRWHMGNRLCSASQEAVITVDREGRVSATVVNAAFHRKKPVDFSSFGPCSEAVLFSNDTVLPPSSFTQSNVLDQAVGGTLQMPPHSVLFLRF